MLKAKKCSKWAEREGFEPSVPVTQYARLAIWCLRPLGHLSVRRVAYALRARRQSAFVERLHSPAAPVRTRRRLLKLLSRPRRYLEIRSELHACWAIRKNMSFHLSSMSTDPDVHHAEMVRRGSVLVSDCVRLVTSSRSPVSPREIEAALFHVGLSGQLKGCYRPFLRNESWARILIVKNCQPDLA